MKDWLSDLEVPGKLLGCLTAIVGIVATMPRP
jgi:hypothetical protein